MPFLRRDPAARGLQFLFLLAALTALTSPTAAQSINVMPVSADPGASVWVNVKLFTGGVSVLATRNDIFFNALTPIQGCVKNADLADKAYSYNFLPNGCSGSGCNGIRVIISPPLEIEGPPIAQTAIADGTVLYACLIAVSSSATASAYLLDNANPNASDVVGNAVTLSAADGGVILDGDCP